MADASRDVLDDYVIARADSISLLVLPPQLSPAARQQNTIPRSGLLIGVDGGATKTMAAAYDVSTEVISIATAGPSKPESVGSQSAIDAIAAATAREPHRPRARVISAVLAIGGVNNLAEQQRILSGLPMIPPGSPVVPIGGAGTFDGLFLTGSAPL